MRHTLSRLAAAVAAWLVVAAPAAPAWPQDPAGLRLDSGASAAGTSALPEEIRLTTDAIGEPGTLVGVIEAVDTDASGIVTVLELGQTLQRRLKLRMSREQPAERADPPAVTRVYRRTGTQAAARLRSEQQEAYSVRQRRQSSELPAVVPNLLEVRF